MEDPDHVPFADLATADLILDAVYAGGVAGSIADDPLARLLPGVGNQGGFRFNRSPAKRTVRFAVLFSTGAEPDWLSGRPHDFETCAVKLWRMMAPATGACDVTRPSRDGGRDAVGEYLLGPASDQVAVEFAIEAKCHKLDNPIRATEVARLISRILHRQFGVFVTTSYFHKQVYDEVRSDRHPIVMICACDIADIMGSHGYGSAAAVQTWFNHRFPVPA